MDNDTYLHNSTVIKKLDDLSVAIGGSEVPTTTTKTNSDFVIGINKSIDAASGKTGVEYPPYSHNTLVTNKLDELAEAISEGGGGGPAPVMGALTATENGNYIPSDYDYDGFNSVSVNVPEPPTPTALKMIASSGAQSIQLPYYSDDGIKLKFKMLAGSLTNASVIFGDVWSLSAITLYAISGKLGLREGGNVNENIPHINYKVRDVEFDYSTGILTLDGDTYGAYYAGGHNVINIFSSNNSGHYSAVALSDILIEQNGVEVMHLEPREDSQTGEGYYYDTIGMQDYYSTTETPLIYTEIGAT